MRTLLLIPILSWAQTIIWQETFNGSTTPPSGWSLSAPNPGGASSNPANPWRIGSRYGQNCCNISTIPGGTCSNAAFSYTVPNQPATITGSPQSNFLHISAANCPMGSFTPPNSTDPALFDGTQAGQTFARTGDISIPAGSAPVKLSFFWICGYMEEGGNQRAYGQVYLSQDGGATWTPLTSRTGSQQFLNQLSWYPDTISLPISRPATIRLGFQFVVQSASNPNAQQPGFIIDELKIYEESVAAPTITLGTVSPSPVCAGGQISVSFTHSGFSGNPVFTAEVLDASNNVVASATGTSSPITVSIPGSLPSGNYAVRVLSGSTQSSTANVQVVNLSGFTCTASATTIQVGQVVTFTLSGTGLPSSGTLGVSFTPGDGSSPQNLSYPLPNGLPASVSHTYTQVGTFTATFAASYGSCSQICTRTITVQGSSSALPIVWQGGSPYLTEVAEIYDLTGRLLARGTTGEMLALPPGAYLLRSASGAFRLFIP